MIREGYQQTVIGLIPSDWEVKKFTDVRGRLKRVGFHERIGFSGTYT